MQSLLYYITGHGYGHALRSALVIRRMLALREDLHVHVRTGAPRGLFDSLSPRVHYHHALLDPGSIERDALTIDWPASLAAVRQSIDQKDVIIARECSFIADHRIGLIVADIPFMAGYVAEAAKVHCWAVGNFTWDWIYQSQLADPLDPILAFATAGYQKMTGLFRLPFPHETPQFKQVIDVPLITAAATQRRRDPSRPPHILIAQRGGVMPQAIERAVRSCPDYQFIGWNILPTGEPAEPGQRLRLASLPNLRYIEPDGKISFNDVLAGCDVVLSKPGHGIVSDCIALGVGLLWPRRDYFREDDMLMRLSQPYLRSRPLSRDAFFTGNWRDDLLHLLSQPHPARALPINGAEVIAKHLVKNA